MLPSVNRCLESGKHFQVFIVKIANGGTASTEGSVKPDLAHAPFNALANDVKSVTRMGGDHDAVDRARY